jgi:hypothetical protein
LGKSSASGKLAPEADIGKRQSPRPVELTVKTRHSKDIVARPLEGAPEMLVLGPTDGRLAPKKMKSAVGSTSS